MVYEKLLMRKQRLLIQSSSLSIILDKSQFLGTQKEPDSLVIWLEFFLWKVCTKEIPDATYSTSKAKRDFNFLDSHPGCRRILGQTKIPWLILGETVTHPLKKKAVNKKKGKEKRKSNQTALSMLSESPHNVKTRLDNKDEHGGKDAQNCESASL